MPIRKRNRIRPTVDSISRESREAAGNNTLEELGDMRPNTEGPSRIPPMISPMTRAWPNFSASHPQKSVVSRMTDICRSRSVTVIYTHEQWPKLFGFYCSASHRYLPLDAKLGQGVPAPAVR